MADIEAAIFRIGQDKLGNVARVVTRTPDGADPEMLWFTVVLSGPQRKGSELIAFQLAARDRLRQLEENRFPVFTFVDATEFGERAAS